MRAGTSIFIICFALLALGGCAYFFPPLFMVWVLTLLAALPFVFGDFIMLRFFTPTLSINREMSASLTIGISASVRLTIARNAKGIAFGTINVFDIYDDHFDCDELPLSIPYPKEGSLSVEYRVLPAERGDWEFSACEVLIDSPFQFWRRKIRYAVKTRGRTYPVFSGITSGTDIRSNHELSGEKRVRKRGIGLEFESLRDWQEGDSVRAIDWRATSRKRQAIVRDYVEEQDQQILIILDSGYRLHRLVNGEDTGTSGIMLTQFDAALNAALLLAYFALKHGDSVATGVFGNTDRWLPPKKGMSALPHIINALYDVKSASVPSSIFSALENTLARLRRRTFIICISNFREEDEEELSRILPLLGRRHLLLMVSLCEDEAGALSNRNLSNSPDTHDDDILLSEAASNYIAQRKKLYKKWEHLGLLTLDTSAANLSAKLINSFLAVKRQGLL
ncbi:MAG: DUF58 domain-containing protein [Spirochaetaceae bacterium]|jgi:uncharacterized protein (DUF58 family)|nr:DUF58 domain-containing protein [Spirochaetaceae bacterium]